MNKLNNNIKIVRGNLITLAKAGMFDLIGHGCNIHCRQKSGIAAQMVEHFNTNSPLLYPLELPSFKGDMKKLGKVQFNTNPFVVSSNFTPLNLMVANCYTQEMWKTKENPKPINYIALRSCMKTLNAMAVWFYNNTGTHMRIGLPWIGCGLAGGDKDIVFNIISKNLTNAQVTIVEYDQS